MGRRLASLEATLGVHLLNRTPDGYVATLAGEGVREQAERLEAEALSLERNVGGRDTRLAGLVRVTSAETVASHILAPCFAELHLQHPDIMIELIPDPRELSLSMREADISVRLARPGQHDLVVRRVGSLAFGLYATPAYLDRHGELDFEGGCPGHHLITSSTTSRMPHRRAGWRTWHLVLVSPFRPAAPRPLFPRPFTAAAWRAWRDSGLIGSQG